MRAAKDSAGHARWLSARSDAEVLRACAIALGLTWSVLFIVVGLGAALELYADGSMFSYAVAVQDVWAFHWHNISGRLSVFLLCLWPAETYVGLTGDPHGGIVLYGLLFYSAPLLGLIGTWTADRSQGRVFFSFACCSTALLCPLIFGFPTEMWLAHALFWPALAVSHGRRTGIGAAALLFALLTALALTHEGAVILAFAIVATLAARGLRHPAFLRAAGCLAAALAVWGAVKALYRPDGYFADMFRRAALNFFDPAIFRVDVVLLLAGTLAAYAIVYVLWRRAAPERALGAATALVAAALAGYFLGFDHSLHASNRYYLRTAFVIATPVLGALAAAIAMQSGGWRPGPSVSRLMAISDAGTGGQGAHGRPPAGDAGACGGNRQIRRRLDRLQGSGPRACHRLPPPIRRSGTRGSCHPGASTPASTACPGSRPRPICPRSWRISRPAGSLSTPRATTSGCPARPRRRMPRPPARFRPPPGTWSGSTPACIGPSRPTARLCSAEPWA